MTSIHIILKQSIASWNRKSKTFQVLPGEVCSSGCRRRWIRWWWYMFVLVRAAIATSMFVILASMRLNDPPKFICSIMPIFCCISMTMADIPQQCAWPWCSTEMQERWECHDQLTFDWRQLDLKFSQRTLAPLPWRKLKWMSYLSLDNNGCRQSHQ